MASIPAPPFDPEFAPMLPALTSVLPTSITLDMIPALRESTAPLFPPVETVIGERAVDVEDRTIPGPPGDPDLVVSVLSPRGKPASGWACTTPTAAGCSWATGSSPRTSWPAGSTRSGSRW